MIVAASPSGRASIESPTIEESYDRLEFPERVGAARNVHLKFIKPDFQSRIGELAAVPSVMEGLKRLKQAIRGPGRRPNGRAKNNPRPRKINTEWNGFKNSRID